MRYEITVGKLVWPLILKSGLLARTSMPNLTAQQRKEGRGTKAVTAWAQLSKPLASNHCYHLVKIYLLERASSPVPLSLNRAASRCSRSNSPAEEGGEKKINSSRVFSIRQLQIKNSLVKYALLLSQSSPGLRVLLRRSQREMRASL